ncbi:hypothetical protein WJX72_004157 [[Myrmecia] bisecta]|uniref:RNA 3'-terminal phosphate cyclase-like protein n=1 Tax=[Myrmecia] bisecta TaxID=41462 RepID=A0AAW1Q0U2_9CHLO
MLRFKGSQHFRQRLVCSTLSGRTILIDDIRSRDQNPGLRDFEACLLRLLEKVTDGCEVEINETGTSLRYRPGLATGGAGLVHDCGKARSIGYFLEPLACIALFGKKPLSITLKGITNDDLDPSVDVWRTVTFPLLRQLTGQEEGFELKVLRRGAPPQGGGEVAVRLPVLRSLPPVSLVQEGMIKRIRGVAHSMKVSPQSSNRMVDGARSVLNSLLPDVYIFTDHMSGPEAGFSPGFGMMLVAESTTGRFISAECSAAQQGSEGLMVPEDVGRQAAHMLLEEIHRGGVTDSAHQGLVLLFCALGPDEINEVRLGPLSPHAVRTLRHLRDFFGITFSVKPEPESQTIFLSCIGANIRNIAKKVT